MADIELTSRELIGRTKEAAQLRRVIETGNPEFIAMIGRRRVGKTYLIKQVLGNDLCFDLTGIQHASKKENLIAFYIAIAKYFPTIPEIEKKKTWIEAFHQLSEIVENHVKGRKVIFLDELPWLASKRSDFMKGLSHFWNSYAVDKNVALIVCGSTTSWMIKKIINDRGGLHNRVTQLIHLQPFTLAEVSQFCDYKKVKLNQFQITQLYMVMGGIPMYLSQLIPGRSAVENINKICFEPSGYLRNEFERLFASLFDNYKLHIEILRALSKKRSGLSRQEIIAGTSFSNGGMLSEILTELEQSGFIHTYKSFEKKVKDAIYRLTDPYSLFYLTFLEKEGNNANIEFDKLSQLPNWKSWSGYAFENVCLMHVDQIRKALGISGIFSKTSSFRHAKTGEMQGAQIDLIIDRGDDTMNLCEMKYTAEPFILTATESQKLLQRKSVFRYYTKTRKNLFTTLVTTYPPVKNTALLNEIDNVVTMDELFVP